MVRRLFFLSLSLGQAYPLLACPMIEQQDLDDFRKANAIVSASVEDYRLIPHPNYDSAEFAVFTIRVERSFKGDLQGIQRIRWHNSTFGLPEERPTPDLLLIAEGSEEGESGTLVETYPLQLFQPPCAPAFLFPFSRDLEERVAQAVSGTLPWSALKDDLSTGSVFPLPKPEGADRDSGAVDASVASHSQSGQANADHETPAISRSIAGVIAAIVVLLLGFCMRHRAFRRDREDD